MLHLRHDLRHDSIGIPLDPDLILYLKGTLSDWEILWRDLVDPEGVVDGIDALLRESLRCLKPKSDGRDCDAVKRPVWTDYQTFQRRERAGEVVG